MPSGANWGTIPFPQLAVTKTRELIRVPSPRRTSWGPTEAELMVGYARCCLGCSAPPVLPVAAGGGLCAACADAMQLVSGGVA